MELNGLADICRDLIRPPLPKSMPVALVQQGTTRHQRVLTGTLATLPGILEKTKVKAPTLIIVGEVVLLREKLDWFRPGAPN